MDATQSYYHYKLYDIYIFFTYYYNDTYQGIILIYFLMNLNTLYIYILILMYNSLILS